MLQALPTVYVHRGPLSLKVNGLRRYTYFNGVECIAGVVVFDAIKQILTQLQHARSCQLLITWKPYSFFNDDSRLNREFSCVHYVVYLGVVH